MEKVELHNSKYCEITRGIRVSVMPEPLETSSDPERGVYAFAYTITVENLGEETVQLLERHWIITSAGSKTGEVAGPGVVGLQPTLAAGEAFRYTSGAVIQDPIGAMEGSYIFRGADDDLFEVVIPRFDLVYPMLLH
jgi:ApaG protein